MNARDVRKINFEFVGKVVESVSFNDNKFTINFKGDTWIEVETDDEPLEYDLEDK